MDSKFEPQPSHIAVAEIGLEIIPMAILSLPLIQVWQLSVTGEIIMGHSWKLVVLQCGSESTCICKRPFFGGFNRVQRLLEEMGKNWTQFSCKLL